MQHGCKKKQPIAHFPTSSFTFFNFSLSSKNAASFFPNSRANRISSSVISVGSLLMNSGRGRSLKKAVKIAKYYKLALLYMERLMAYYTYLEQLLFGVSFQSASHHHVQGPLPPIVSLLPRQPHTSKTLVKSTPTCHCIMTKCTFSLSLLSSSSLRCSSSNFCSLGLM